MECVECSGFWVGSYLRRAPWFRPLPPKVYSINVVNMQKKIVFLVCLLFFLYLCAKFEINYSAN
jgi:hypothetical protein